MNLLFLLLFLMPLNHKFLREFVLCSFFCHVHSVIFLCSHKEDSINLSIHVLSNIKGTNGKLREIIVWKPTNSDFCFLQNFRFLAKTDPRLFKIYLFLLWFREIKSCGNFYDNFVLAFFGLQKALSPHRSKGNNNKHEPHEELLNYIKTDFLNGILWKKLWENIVAMLQIIIKRRGTRKKNYINWGNFFSKSFIFCWGRKC